MEVSVSLPGSKAATAWGWPHFSMYWGFRNPWSSVSPSPHIFTACTEAVVLLHRKMIAFSYENKAKVKYGQSIELFGVELYCSYRRIWSWETIHSGRLLWTRPRRMRRMSSLFFVYNTTHCNLLRLTVRSGLDIPTFATRRLHACHHARAPSGGRWNCGREMSGNFA
jgi:hypothetical protein